MFAVVLLAVAQPPGPPEFFQKNVQVLTTYHRKPDPTLGPKLLAELIAPKTLENAWVKANPHPVELTAAMFGEIGRGHPETVRAYEKLYPTASAAGKAVIRQVLDRCGDADTPKAVADWKPDPAVKRHRDRPATTPKDCDFLYADFYITGEYAPVSRVLDVFDRPESDATLTRVAKWSLGSNIKQHPRMKEVVTANLEKRPAASRKVAEELLDAK